MTATDDLIPWLLKRIAMDEQSAHAMTHAIEHLVSLWSPARLLAHCEAKRRIIKLYQNATAAQRQGSIVERYNVQDEAAVDVLGAAVQELAVPYADKPGYREEWRP